MLENLCAHISFGGRDPSPCGINSWLLLLALMAVAIALWYWENY